MLSALLIEEVEAVAQKGEEIPARPEHPAAEFHVVRRRRVGDDEVRLVAHPYPIGQLVIVGVAVVEEAAILDDQPPCVLGRCVAAIPAMGRFAGRLADQRDGAGDLLALLSLLQLVVLDPAIAMAADVPVGRGDRRRGGRVRRQRPGAGEQGHRQPESGEDPMEPPPPNARAVFEHAFGGEVAAIAGIGTGALDEAGLGDAVACRVGELRALLEIDHEVDRDARPTGPARIWRRRAIADEIAGHFASPGGSGYHSALST